MRKLCVYGLAGSGKSTASAMIAETLGARGFSVEVVKLAEPLYRLQQHIYETAGRPVPLWTHDNELLRTLATQLRRINPQYLVDDFLRRLDTGAARAADVVLNDDLRDAAVDYPGMAARGFQFLFVSCPDDVRAARLRARGDVTVVADDVTTWGFDRITPDWTIENGSDDPGQLAQQLGVVVDKWLAQQPSD
jgi:thymidylate kinase